MAVPPRAGADRDHVAGDDFARRTPGAHGDSPASTSDGAQSTHAGRAARCLDSRHRCGAFSSASAVAPFGTARPRKNTAQEPGPSAQTFFCTLDSAAFASALASQPRLTRNPLRFGSRGDIAAKPAGRRLWKWSVGDGRPFTQRTPSERPEVGGSKGVKKWSEENARSVAQFRCPTVAQFQVSLTVQTPRRGCRGL